MMLCFERATFANYDAEMREIEYVQVTATRRAERDFDVAAALSQIDDASIRSEAPDVLAEMLRGLPGTFFQQTTPGQGIPIIRGLKGSQVLHLVDGIRLNNAFFRDAPNQYLGLVDAYSTRKIEVVRGSAGSLYGADAMGGVVNILTAEPRFDDEYWRQNMSLYGAYNHADRGWVGRAETEGGQQGFAWRGGVTWQDTGDRRVGGGDRVVPSAYQARAADLKFIFDLGTFSELMLNAQFGEQPNTPRIDELVPGFGQTEPASAEYAFKPNRRNFFHARWRHESTSRWFDSLQVHAARQVITDDRITRDWNSPLLNREDNSSTLDVLNAQWDFTLSGGQLMTWGLELNHDRIESSRQRENLDTGELRDVRSRFPDGSSMDSISAFAALDWQAAARWHVGAGLRYSRFDIRLPKAPDIAAAKLTPADVTGDLRVLFEVSPALHFVANAGRGFRPPNIFDLGTLGPRPGNRFNIANTDLGPESVVNIDMGLKGLSSHFEFEVFVFKLDYRDKITSVPTGEFTPSGRMIVRSENRNEVRIFGLEAGARWMPGADFNVYGVINFTRAEESEESGLKVPGDRIPPLNGKLGLEHQISASWRWDLYWLFAGEQDRLSPRDMRDPRINPQGTPGWGTLNASLGWQPNARFEAGIRLENLADKRYREHGSGIDAQGFNIGLWLQASW